VSARVGGICALLAVLAFTIGSVAGGFAQPSAYSWAKNDLSDLGAVTANSAWLYNQVAANLTAVLIAVVGLALWRALSPDIVGRIGAAGLVATGVSYFFDGIFRLDCRGIDAGCRNVSWHAHAHKTESVISAVLLLGTPFILALAFRRNAEWRGAWLPTLLVTPVALVVGIPFSALGSAAAQRATTWTWFVWLAYLGLRLLRLASPERGGLSPSRSRRAERAQRRAPVDAKRHSAT
jgi:hypothetical protein